MYFIEETSTQTLEIKQSKFIAYLTPYRDFQNTLETLKELHPKARHFVVAYRYLNEYSQVLEHSSDDGEPKGTSGKPSLMVLQGANLINTAVIIVRYFGGTKLGTGGLVRAYSDAVNLALSLATLIEYKKLSLKRVAFKYSDVRMVDYECEKYGVNVKNKIFDIDVLYEIEGDEESIEALVKELALLITLK